MRNFMETAHCQVNSSYGCHGKKVTTSNLDGKEGQDAGT